MPGSNSRHCRKSASGPPEPACTWGYRCRSPQSLARHQKTSAFRWQVLLGRRSEGECLFMEKDCKFTLRYPKYVAHTHTYTNRLGSCPLPISLTESLLRSRENKTWVAAIRNRHSNRSRGEKCHSILYRTGVRAHHLCKR